MFYVGVIHKFAFNLFGLVSSLSKPFRSSSISIFCKLNLVISSHLPIRTNTLSVKKKSAKSD